MPPADRDWTQSVWILSGLGTGPMGNKYGDITLRLVQRGHTGKAVAAKAADGVLNALIGAQNTSFSKENVRGDQIDSVPSPARLMTGLLHERLAEYFSDYPDAIPYERKRVEARAGQWSLIYQKLSNGSSPFVLEHDATISFVYPDGHTSNTVYCKDEPRIAPLDQWQANDYAMVRAAAEEMAEQCVGKYVATLPRMFPELAPLEPEAP